MSKHRTEQPARQSRFPDGIHIRCPASLPKAIKLAARKNLTTSAEYTRRSVIDRLKADGFDPSQLSGVA